MSSFNTFIDHLFMRRRWLIHIAYWLAILGFYILFFGRRNDNFVLTSFFVALLMPVIIAATYVLNYYLVPRYLMGERYLKFFVYFFYLLLGALMLELMVSFFTFLVMASLSIRAMSTASIDLIFLLASLLMVVFLGVAIKMVLHWRQTKEDYQKLMRDKLESELKFLKTQLNPHFLFNTLNNLYYLAVEKSEKTPQAILALSEILDYVLHAGKSLTVPLASELKQVDNYISLELLRYDDRVEVRKNVAGNPEGHQLPPMLIITLVENAFKHGVMPMAGKSWIDLAVIPGDELTIVVKNKWESRVSGNGIGLQNLRSQLNLLYHDRYDWRVLEDGQEFSITLTLNKNEI